MITLLLLSTPLLLQQPGGGQFMPSWETPFPQSGDSLVAIQDLDGDGVQDWLRVDRLAEQQFYQQGSLTAVSGLTGGVLWEFFGPERLSRLDIDSSNIVDLDGDGRMEILLPFPNSASIHAGGHGRLTILDSVSGAALWQAGGQNEQTHFAYNLVATDLDGDGVLELIASSKGAPPNRPLDRISCFDATGSMLWEVELEFQGREIKIADLTGNGDPEILLIDSFLDGGGADKVGRISALAGNDGQLLWQRWGSHEYESLGWDLILQDLDHDGATDILALGPVSTVNGLLQAGAIVRISGLDGHEIWRLNGDHANGRLGGAVGIADLNSDGIEDVFLGVPAHNQNDGLVMALHGGTGNLLWQTTGTTGAQAGLGQQIWLGDFQNTGGLQVLAEARVGQGIGVDNRFNGWQMLEASTGQTLWQLQLNYASTVNPSFHISDFDGDGVSEFVMNNVGARNLSNKAAGIVAVFDATGQMLWTQRGEVALQQYGSRVLLEDFDADGNKDVLVAAIDTAAFTFQRRGMLEVRAGSSGDLLWRREGKRSGHRFGVDPILADLNHDGQVEILSSSWSATGWRGASQGELDVLDGSTGETLWQVEGDRAYAFLPKDVAIAPDVDADGWDEVLILGNDKLFSMPGYGNFHGFMTASDDFLSVAAGGSIDLNLDFLDQAAWMEYRIVFSGHGAGLNHKFGIPIPLVLDHWLYLSEAGGLPTGHLRHAEGVLDILGQGQAQIQFGPAQIPSSMIGHSLTFAALARVSWLDWQFCSVPISISVQP